MPLRSDLLTPIAGENPSGTDLHRVLHREISEARREDDDLPQGDYERVRKKADFALITKLTQENLATRTKDLKLATWLTEALFHLEGFTGLHQGLQVCTGLITNFWDTLYPAAPDGDVEARANLLAWLATSLEFPVKMSPVVKSGGYDIFKYKESRTVPTEKQAEADENEKAKREQLIKEKKLTPEAFDSAFNATPKTFYVQAESGLLGSLAELKKLDGLCDEKIGREAAPSFVKLRGNLEEIERVIQPLLQRKLALEPDLVPKAPAAAEPNTSSQSTAEPAQISVSPPAVMPSIVIPLGSSEPPERKEAVEKIAYAAAHLRKLAPHNPAPYLLMRGYRWGELRAVPDLSNPRLLEAPDTKLRQQVKLLALDKKWAELLDVAENSMSLPCSRAWLDLQRLVITACMALGAEYEPVATAIRSELRNLLRDIPNLLNATLLDDTPAANSETRTWLQELIQPSGQPSSGDAGESEMSSGSPESTVTSSWTSRAVDPFELAKDAVRAGNLQKGFQIMRAEIARQRSGRGRFQRRLQLVQLCVDAGNDAIAQPLIDDVAVAIDNHKLDDWEDGEMVAAALDTVLRVSKKLSENPEATQKLFERICRLDPVRGLRVG
jgi:type VI secretion system protein ImpA